MTLPPDTEPAQSPREALGCGLLLMGVLGTAFGLAALLGIGGGVELEFFGIELDDTRGRLIWVAGSMAAVALGILTLRASRRAG